MWLIKHRIAIGLSLSLSEVEEMPADELASWRAYYEIEPWGIHGMEILMANLCQTIVASAGGKSPEFTTFMPMHNAKKKMIVKTETIDAYEAIKARMAAFGVGVSRDV
jgi:hypothetical protein